MPVLEWTAFISLSKNKIASDLLRPNKSIQIHSVLFVLGSEESLPPRWVHTAIYFMRTFYIREKKGDVEGGDNYVNSEAALFRKELRVPSSIISTVFKLLTGLRCCLLWIKAGHGQSWVEILPRKVLKAELYFMFKCYIFILIFSPFWLLLWD